MAAKYIIRRRQNKLLSGDTLISIAIIGFILIKYYQVHPAIALLIGIAAYFFSILLFFSTKIFRYLFSVFFSLIWGLAAFVLGQFIETSSDTTASMFGFLAICFSLLAITSTLPFGRVQRIITERGCFRT